jgi:hypothetical protein
MYAFYMHQLAQGRRPPSPIDAVQLQGGGAKGATVMKPRGGTGFAASEERTGGACAPPRTRPIIQCTPSPCVGSQRMGSGASGRAVVPHHLAKAPRGVDNLGEALAAICSLTSFPPMLGDPAYRPWEA